MKKIVQSDIQNLINWFKLNERKLPWRNPITPYTVWISEIMLQQTRIHAVIPKFLTFVQELPDIESLANCNDDKLMKLWEGLGYYSRARNLKKCANDLIQDYNGEFPHTKKELIKLPGIGDYTAGAIATTCFEEKVSAIDGNVLRVLARYFGYTKDIRSKETLTYFDQMILSSLTDVDSKDVRYFTQGLMEIGETICVPKGEPSCSTCPFHMHCVALKENTITTIPYRSKLKERKIIDKTVFIIRNKDHYLIHKRDSTGLLANLYEFPNIDQVLSKEETLQYLEKYPINIINIKESIIAKHVFTHIEWHMHGYEIEIDELHQSLFGNNYYFLSKEELAKISIPSAFQAYLKHYHLR